MDPAISKCDFCTKNNKSTFKIAWLKQQTQKAIAEHFWFKESELLLFQICSGCTKKVMHFHQFYTAVKRLHAAKDHHLEDKGNLHQDVIVKNEPLDSELVAEGNFNGEQLIVGDSASEIVDVSTKTEVFKDEKEIKQEEAKVSIINNETSTFDCLNCDKAFEDRKILKLHMKLVHGEQIAVRKCTKCALLEKALRETLEQNIAEVPKSSGRVQCAVCDGKMKNVASLQKHLARHWGETCSMCSKRPENYEQTKTEQKNDNNKGTEDLEKAIYFVCKSCGKQYLQRKYLKAHIDKYHKFWN